MEEARLDGLDPVTRRAPYRRALVRPLLTGTAQVGLYYPLPFRGDQTVMYPSAQSAGVRLCRAGRLGHGHPHPLGVAPDSVGRATIQEAEQDTARTSAGKETTWQR
jgi:hypothetical protein